MPSDPPATCRRHGVAWLACRLPHAALALVIAAVGVTTGSSAWAHFATTGAGAGGATTGILVAPTSVVATATVNSGTVPLTWTAATSGTGLPVQGYYVQRVRSSDQLVTPACGSSPTNLTATASCNDLLVPDGTYRYQVTAILGSWTAVSALSGSVTVVNDSTLPTITVTSTSPTPNASGYVNTSPVTVNLSASPGSAGSPIISLTFWVDAAASTTVSAASTSVSVSGHGNHVVSFYATDSAGRRSITSTFTVRIDTVAPSAPSAPVLTAATDTGASATDRITRITTPTFTGTAEASSTVTVYDGATVVGTGTATGGTYTITGSTLTAGTHTITARATDPAGNISTLSTAATVVIDTTAPAAPSTPALPAASDSGRSTSDKITNLTTPTFTGTAETSATVTLLDGTLSAGSGTAPSGSWSISTTALSDGAHTIGARATDLAGNTSTASTGTAISIDTLAPTAPSKPTLTAASDSGSTSTDGITNVTRPAFTGTTEKKAIVTLKDNGATLVVSAAVNSGSFSLTSTALADGTHPITATATDIAGNTSVASSITTVVIDTVAPVTSAPTLTAASDTGISATDRITRATTPTVTGTSQAGANVILLDGTTQVGTGSATGGTYTITSGTLASGSRSLSARATDLAGNAGAASATTTVTVDITAPTVTINQAVGQADPATTSPVAFTAVFSETVYGFIDSRVSLTGSAGATSATVTGTGPSYSIAASGMTGTGLVTATIPAAGATDTAGNASTSSTSTDNTVTYTKP